MRSPYYLLVAGEVIGTADVHFWEEHVQQRFALWHESGVDMWRVGYTELGDVTVSTVFLGMDFGFWDGPPRVFETMIFGGDHDGTQWRYSTWAEAERGHAAACALAPTSVN